MKTTRHRLPIVVILLALASNCTGCFGCASPVENGTGNLPSTCQTQAPLIEPQKLDILFVIDNSNSMIEEQTGVARELSAFVDAIRKAGGVRQDFHVGVVTTTVYQHTLVNGVDWWRQWPDQAGLLRAVPDQLADGGFNYDTANERVLLGDDPDVAPKFAKLVQQGVQGSGQETPFEAVRLALIGYANTVPLDAGGNLGFVRDGSRVLIVVLSDEDDCSETARPSLVTIGDSPSVADCTDHANSLYPVGEYQRLFTTQILNDDGTPHEIIWAAIAPVSTVDKSAMAVIQGGQVRNIDCPTSNQAGFRHRAMAELFDPTLSNLDSICRDSYRDTLIHIAELASVSQTVNMSNVPDPNMLRVGITRADGSQVICTQSNGGIVNFVAGATAKDPAKVTFGNQCKRRADDQKLDVQLLCAT
jgi:hypothetical protein